METTMIPRVAWATMALGGLAQGAPHWIWAPPHNGQTPDSAVFRQEIEVKPGLKRAVLRMAADNAARALINGREVLKNDSWSDPSRTEVSSHLKEGRNEIRIEARNDPGSPAGLVVSLVLTGEDDTRIAVESNDTWTVSTSAASQFQPVAVLGAMGVDPWGDVFGGRRNAGQAVVAGEAVQTLPGFKAELIYTVPREDQGSWVSLTTDPQGRIIAGDQYGGLYRVTPPAVGKPVDPATTRVENLGTTIGGAHGLLWAFDSLYAVVCERPTAKSEPGLWRLRDEDGDGNFEKEEHLLRLEGGGEHGPHSVVLSPDGASLYVACGNHTKPPRLDTSRAARAWQEDHLLPRMWDANGHAVNIMAPGGYVIKTDPEGRQVEMFCYGFRNQYDISFNTEGDLYTFDADMEWDMGAPWYRATRIVHCVSGADYGWRSGSGKWPAYYPDSLPPTYDIGPGSPTGTVFGTGAKFPARYQAAFYACDWTFGTMYAVHLSPDGATHKAEVEEFVSGKPLPLTDLLIHPKDGSMYFAIGGRKTQSALYRVTYTGSENSEPLAHPVASGHPPPPAATLRRELEKLHVEPTDGSAAAGVVDKAWRHLDHPDRFVRHAARVAVERQPSESWLTHLRDETRANAIIEGCVALARTSQLTNTQSVVFEKLSRMHEHKLSLDQRLAALRALQLTLIRQGMPDAETTGRITRALGSMYPSNNDFLDRELCQILVFLGDSGVVAKSLQLMAVAREAKGDESASAQLLARNDQYARDVQGTMAGRPNRQQMALAWSLRHATNGWSPELRKQYFAWFPTTKKWRGGNSFHGFIENARKEALAHVPEAERAGLDALSTKADAPAVLTFTPPQGPGRPYTIDDIMRFADGKLQGRNFASGKNLYEATACSTCHRFNGEGGGLGPDLSGSGNRYTLRDLVENLIEPSKVISDQYESTQIELLDGGLLVGRVMKEEDGLLHVAMNPLAPSEVIPVPANTVAARKPYPISMMPPGLLNRLNEEEVLDLLAYLQSGGNPEDPAFAK